MTRVRVFLELNLTLNLLTTTIVAPPSNASKWQMGFNSAFKGLMALCYSQVSLMLSTDINIRETTYSCQF